MGTFRFAWLFVALLMFTSSFGWFINDEADQAAALDSLAQGSLRVTGDASSSYALADNITWQRRWDDTPVASTPLNFLALPVIPILLVADALAPLSVWFSTVAVLGLWRGLGFGWPWKASFQGLVGAPVRVALFLLLIAVATRGLRVTGPDVPFYVATIALQVTNLALTGGTTWLLGQLVSKPLGKTPGKILLLCGVVTGPWLFWAHGLKYHVLGAAAITVMLWLSGRPRKHRLVFLGLVAGFAAWVNIGIGVVAGLAIGLFEISRHNPEPIEGAWAKRWSRLLGGMALGATPMFLENYYLFGNPLFSFYFSGDNLLQGTTTATTLASISQGIGGTIRAILEILRGILHWNGPMDFLLNLTSILTSGWRTEGNGFGIFLATPLLAFATIGAVAVISRRERSPAMRLALMLLLVQTILLTNAGVRQGAGFDPRLWFHVIPAFSLLAALGGRSLFLELTSNDLKASFALALLGASASIGLAILIAKMGYGLGPHGRTEFRLFYYGSLAVLAGGFAVVLAGSLMMRQDTKTWARRLVGGFGLAVPLVWTIMLLVVNHTHIPRTGSHEGGSTFVPIMDDIGSELHRAIFPAGKLPFVYDGNGTLVFHPDYGLCTRNPSPCPDSVRAASQRESMTVEAFSGKGTA